MFSLGLCFLRGETVYMSVQMCKFVRLCKHVSAQTRVYTSSDLNTQTFELLTKNWSLCEIWVSHISVFKLLGCHVIFLHTYFKTLLRYLFPSPSGWSSVWKPFSRSCYSTLWFPNVFFFANPPNLKRTRSTAVGQGINFTGYANL